MADTVASAPPSRTPVRASSTPISTRGPAFQVGGHLEGENRRGSVGPQCDRTGSGVVTVARNDARDPLGCRRAPGRHSHRNLGCEEIAGETDTGGERASRDAPAGDGDRRPGVSWEPVLAQCPRRSPGPPAPVVIARRGRTASDPPARNTASPRGTIEIQSLGTPVDASGTRSVLSVVEAPLPTQPRRWR